MNRTWIAASIFLVSFIAGIAWATNPSDPEAWNSTYETNPAAGDNVSQGDDWIRQHKKEIRRRVEVEHQIGSGAGPATAQGDNGAHRIGSGRCFVSNTAPTALSDSSELHDNNAPGSGSGTLTAVETNGDGGANDVAIGHGRCWYDAGDGSFWIFNDSDAGTSAANDGWNKVAGIGTGGSGARNRILNGGFEMDGEIGIGLATCTDANSSPARDDDPQNDHGGNQTTGSADGFCDAEVTFNGNAGYYQFVGPAVRGWAVLGSPSSYSLDATDDEAGFGLEFTVGSDSAGDGIQQTLADLEASTEYFVFGSVLAASGATCAMDVGGESSTTLPVTSTATTFTVVSGFFTTDSTPTSITLELDETAGAASCSWDNITVLRVGSDVSVPNQDWIYFQEDETTTSADDALNTDLLTWAGGSCLWKISATVTSDGTGFPTGLELQFDEDDDGNYTELFDWGHTGGNLSTVSITTVVDTTRLNDAAAAGTDTGDALVAGDDLRFRVEDNSTNNIDCNTTTHCEMVIEQICSSI
jgi:hypothetical protein